MAILKFHISCFSPKTRAAQIRAKGMTLPVGVIISIYISLLMIWAVSPLPAQVGEWSLVWSDEFNSPSIDLSKWTHEINANGGGNNELQYYVNRAENSFIRDGKLVIRSIKERYTGPEGTRDYTSARLNSRFKGDWLYGRIEVSAKLPGGQGTWPAIWMLPSDWEYGGWAASGEIDIMEHRGDLPSTLFGTIHYGGPYPNNVYAGTTIPTPDLTQAFHQFAIEWEPGVIRWYFDGQNYQTLTDWWSAGGAYPAPFNKRFHIILNQAIGGNFLPNPPADANYFPRDFEIDYVRVFQRQREQLPFQGVARTIPGVIEAEDFDEGGPMTAYSDTDSVNNGSTNYRPGESVDIESTSDIGGGFNVGWINVGEWLEYTINVTETGTFVPKARVASESTDGRFALSFLQDSTTFDAGEITFSATGGWQNWETVSLPQIELPSGTHIMRFDALDSNFNLNYFMISASETSFVPYSGLLFFGE